MDAGSKADREAILALIAEETAAYFAKDYERWARCWVHAPYARRMGWYAHGGVLVHSSWEQEASLMKLNMEAYPVPNRSAAELRREQISIRAGRDIAWATFEQVAPRTGDPFDVPGRQHEARILEKYAGQWKIACCFVLGSGLEFANHPLIQVDARSRVLWMNAAAHTQIKDHASLALIGGRLRCRDVASDRRLQATIRWAADLKGYADRQAAGAAFTRHSALPVLLQPQDSASHHVCWVIAEGGLILVSFNDLQAIRQRLEAAAVVYSITPAQMRLADLIVSGLDLVEAAGRLGVSVNTARTQLKRMFEKTGVNSQPTLVRALLSVAAPLP